MARRRGKGRFDSEEEDPMAGTANLVDAMLVPIDSGTEGKGHGSHESGSD